MFLFGQLELIYVCYARNINPVFLNYTYANILTYVKISVYLYNCVSPKIIHIYRCLRIPILRGKVPQWYLYKKTCLE